MTSLSIVEQANLFLDIKNEEGAKWQTHVPYEYHSERKDLSLVEQFLTIIAPSACAFLGSIYLPDGALYVLPGMAVYIIYLSIRISHVRVAYATARAPIISQAELVAEEYLTRRCAELSVDVDELRRWVTEMDELYDLSCELVDAGIEVIPQPD